MAMARPQTQQEYDDIVNSLAHEFYGELLDGEELARNIAQHVIAGLDIIDGEPVVEQEAVYEGGVVETLETALYPYDVVTYTRAELPGAVQDDGAVECAVTALQKDLNKAFRLYGHDGPEKAGEALV